MLRLFSCIDDEITEKLWIHRVDIEMWNADRNAVLHTIDDHLKSVGIEEHRCRC